MKKSTLLHLRIPFSFFLLPVFLFAVALLPEVTAPSFVLVFFILHFLLYPASNGYNSYFDRDEGSIGGLKTPPQVSGELYATSLTLDAVALILGLMISVEFCLMLLVYGLVSKAYSHPAVRLKKYPMLGWLAAGIFQGYFTFMMVLSGVSGNPLSDTFTLYYQEAGLLCTFLLFGSYPMTQVYQHEEDARRGDETLSLKLGVMKTFRFTAVFFILSAGMFVFYFSYFFDLSVAYAFLLAIVPVVGFFLWWWKKTSGDLSAANYENTMRLNFISSFFLNLFFLWLLIFS